MRQKNPNIYIELVADKCAINSVVKIMPSSTRSINLKEVFSHTLAVTRITHKLEKTKSDSIDSVC